MDETTESNTESETTGIFGHIPTFILAPEKKVEINAAELRFHAEKLDEAMRILQESTSESSLYEDDTVNLLRVGSGIGQAIQLVNMVYFALLLKSTENTIKAEGSDHSDD